MPHPRRWLVARSVATALTVAAVLPAVAVAAPTWLPATTSAEQHASQPATLAMSDGGTIASAYQASTPGRIVANYKHPGDALDEAVITTPALNDTVGDYRVATNDNGDAIIVFDAKPGSYSGVYAVYRASTDDAWSAPQLISAAEPTANSNRPNVALDEDGNALITFVVGPGGPYDGNVTAVDRTADGELSAPDTLELAGGGDAAGAYPAVAIDSTGRATIAYSTDPWSGNDAIFRAERPASDGATFAAAQKIVDESDPESGPWTDSRSMRAEVNNTGDIVIAWETRKTGGWDETLLASVRDETGLWGDVKELRTDTGGFYGWDVGIDDAGEALAVMTGGSVNQAMRFDTDLLGWYIDESFPTPAETGILSGLSLDVAGDGNAILAWQQSPYDIAIARRTPAYAGTWTIETPAAEGPDSVYSHPRNSLPAVGLDDEGNAAVTWQHQANGTDPNVQQTRLFDNAGPGIELEDVPATVELGQPANMAVYFEDRISDVTYAWDFGDGTTGTDRPDPPKTYTTLGSKTVTVTGTDEAGNQTTHTETIEVVDTVEPETAVDTVTNGNIATDPVGTFSGTDNDPAGVDEFECQIDTGTPFACQSGDTFTDLADGSHTLKVAAIDPSGNKDDTPASKTFTVDKTAPTIRSFVRANNNPFDNVEATYYVIFDEAVSGLSTDDFTIETTGDVTGATVKSVTQPPTDYAVTVTTGTGDGTLTLKLEDDDSVVDAAGNPIGGAGVGNGDVTGPTYTINKTAPTVESVVRKDTDPTRANTVDYTVTFSETVYGFDVGDLDLTKTGTIDGEAIVVGAPWSEGKVFDVTVGTGTGDGTLRLDVRDDGSVSDGAGKGLVEAFTGGEVYTIDRTAPDVQIVEPADNAEVADNTPLLLGIGEQNAGDVHVEIVEQGETTPVFSDDVTVDEAGEWSAQVPDALELGTYVATVTQTDAAGNQAQDSSAFESTTAPDTTDPQITFTGGVPENGRTANPVHLTFEADEDVTFTCRLDGGTAASCQDGTAPRNGRVTYDDVPAGGHTITVTATDMAGNSSESVRAFTVDTTAPTVAIIAPADGTVTNDRTVTISGTASQGAGDRDIVNVEVVPADAGGEPDPLHSGTPTVEDGEWTTTSGELPDGEYRASVYHRDEAGNDTRDEVRFEIETVKPTVGITAPTANHVFTTAKATFSGTASAAPGDIDEVEVVIVLDDPNAQMTEYDGVASVSGGEWTIIADALPNGRYVAWAHQYDVAGNYDAQSVPFQIAVPAAQTPGGGTATEQQRPAGPQLPPVVDEQAVGPALTRSAQGIVRMLAKTSIQQLLSKPSTLVPFQAPGQGTVKVDYLAPVASASAAKKKKAKAVVVATGRKTVGAAGAVSVRVKVTKAGRKVLKRAKRLSLTVRTSFTATGATSAATSTKKVTVKRKAAKKKKR